MAGTFPTISRGDVCLYPVTRTLSAATRILQFTNGTEQRFVSAPILDGWVFQYAALSAADVGTLQSFFDDQKGAFDATWSLPFLGGTFTGCCFDQDDFSPVRAVNNRHSLSLKIRQTQQSESIPSVSAVYPQLSGGVIVQAPYTTARRFQTLRNDMASGKRYAFANRTTPLYSFTIQYGLITESELNTILAFFRWARGCWKAFSFTDPNSGTTFTNCRFGADQLSCRYNDIRQCSATVAIEQYAV